MQLARVEGNIVGTRKHPSLEGWRLVICQPIGQSGEPEGAPQIAIDSHGAAMHQEVIISSDGLAARLAVANDRSPARWLVIGIVDEHEPGKRI
jgi:ethanolamine utilization protein EutN